METRSRVCLRAHVDAFEIVGPPRGEGDPRESRFAPLTLDVSDARRSTDALLARFRPPLAGREVPPGVAGMPSRLGVHLAALQPGGAVLHVAPIPFR